MSSGNLPVILIEVVLVFGGVLAFGCWQLRSVARDRRELAAQRERDARVQAQAQAEASSNAPAPAGASAAAP